MMPQRSASRFMKLVVILSLVSLHFYEVLGFVHCPSVTFTLTRLVLAETRRPPVAAVSSVDEASQILLEWDRHYNLYVEDDDQDFDVEMSRSLLPEAVRVLAEKADKERNEDSTKGRCMLGICASSTEEAVRTLKAWVPSLQLPRGLLHGMDKDGVPIDIQGSVYIKYNTGGSATFADIRRSGIGFEALWKPGDALLESYDGTFRGVYFQVELSDGVFRQYLVPLDTFVLEDLA
jgi:hypothetical protein